MYATAEEAARAHPEVGEGVRDYLEAVEARRREREVRLDTIAGGPLWISPLAGASATRVWTLRARLRRGRRRESGLIHSGACVTRASVPPAASTRRARAAARRISGPRAACSTCCASAARASTGPCTARGGSRGKNTWRGCSFRAICFLTISLGRLRGS